MRSAPWKACLPRPAVRLARRPGRAAPDLQAAAPRQAWAPQAARVRQLLPPAEAPQGAAAASRCPYASRPQAQAEALAWLLLGLQPSLPALARLGAPRRAQAGRAARCTRARSCRLASSARPTGR